MVNKTISSESPLGRSIMRLAHDDMEKGVGRMMFVNQ